YAPHAQASGFAERHCASLEPDPDRGLAADDRCAVRFPIAPADLVSGSPLVPADASDRCGADTSHLRLVLCAGGLGRPWQRRARATVGALLQQPEWRG